MTLSGIEIIGALVMAGGVLFAPGYVMLRLISRITGVEARLRQASAISTAALSLALTLSLVPMLWLGATYLGARWTAGAISLTWLALCVIALAWAAVDAWRLRRARPLANAEARSVPRRWIPGAALAVLLVGGLLARLYAVRDLAYPAWVDSPHHDLIVRLLMSSGHIPESYDPLMPVTPFSYHFGFHAVAAVFVWLTGLPSSDGVLILGQVLNGLMPLSAFAFALGMTRRPWIAVGAAAIVGWVSLFPGYYVSWGRYTQLTGLVILGPLLGWLTAFANARSVDGSETESPATRWGQAILLGILAAGLIYAHYRILAFALTYGLTLLAVNRRGTWRVWGLAGGVTLLLSGPWLWRLALVWVAPRLSNPESYLAAAGYNDFPWQYFDNWLERGWWGIAALGAGVGLVRRDRAIGLIAFWAALTTVLLNIPGAGSWVVNNNSWAISAFLPGSVAAGYGLEQLGYGVLRLWRYPVGVLVRPSDRARRLLSVVFGLIWAAVSGVGLVRGIQGQAAILNTRTVLALPADRVAITWMRENLPSDAMIVVNSWYWQDGIWSASDGGIWIWTETGRSTTTPPADYYFDPVWTKQINDWNARWSVVQDLNSPEAAALLREVGATHLYLGALPGRVTPEMVAAAPERFHAIFDRDGVKVYEITP